MRPDDGLLDVRVFRGFSGWGLARHLGRVIWGRRSYSPQISVYRSSTVLVEAGTPLPCRADAMEHWHGALSTGRSSCCASGHRSSSGPSLARAASPTCYFFAFQRAAASRSMTARRV